MASRASKVKFPRYDLLKEVKEHVPPRELKVTDDKFSKLSTKERCNMVYGNYLKAVVKYGIYASKTHMHKKDLNGCPEMYEKLWIELEEFVLARDEERDRKKAIKYVEELSKEDKCAGFIDLYELTVAPKWQESKYAIGLENLIAEFCPAHIMTVKRETWKKARDAWEKSNEA